jgi:hypothetical protein
MEYQIIVSKDGELLFKTVWDRHEARVKETVKLLSTRMPSYDISVYADNGWKRINITHEYEKYSA